MKGEDETATTLVGCFELALKPNKADNKGQFFSFFTLTLYLIDFSLCSHSVLYLNFEISREWENSGKLTICSVAAGLSKTPSLGTLFSTTLGRKPRGALCGVLP